MMRGKKNIQNCTKLHKNIKNCKKIAIFLKIAKNRGRHFLEGAR